MTQFPTTGQSFARYELVGTLGRGGFATVFRARDPDTGQNVALKILEHDADRDYDPRTRARFAREVAIHKTLRHPSTVRLQSDGEFNGFLYAVFEIVEGTDLREIIGSGPLPPIDAVAILMQTLAALHEAHSRGLLHRDIKPENIRVSGPAGDRHATLLDFGIARSTDDSHPSVTKTGELVGTPRYMSPEQLTGRPLSPASDVYSLGVVAIEMLAGHEALHGNSWAAQLERLTDEHEFPIPEHLADPNLVAVLRRMSARRTRDRYASAGAVLSALNVHPLPAPAQTPQRVPRVGLIVAAVACLVLLVVAVVSYLRPERSETSSTLPPPATGAALMKRAVPEQPPAIADTASTADTSSATAKLAPADARASGGCGQEPLRNGVVRTPDDYDIDYPHPLVVLLHSDWQPPDMLLAHGGFAELAESERFVVFAPRDGFVRAWRSPDSVSRIRQLVDAQSELLCLDLNRIYVAANGDSGRVAVPLACSEGFAGVGVWGYSTAPPLTERSCDGSRPTPVIWMAPLNSRAVPVDGGPNCSEDEKMSFSELEKYWGKRNGCVLSRRPTNVAESTCWDHECDGMFTSCLIAGGAPWPGTLGAIPDAASGCPPETAPTFPVAETMWRFFERTSL